MVRAMRFHCRGQGFHPLVGELRSCKPCGVVRKKKKMLHLLFVIPGFGEIFHIQIMEISIRIRSGQTPLYKPASSWPHLHSV